VDSVSISVCHISPVELFWKETKNGKISAIYKKYGGTIEFKVL
jgi:hypothetical protein